MRIVITGATGLIGGQATKFFSGQGYEVIGLVRNTSRVQENFLSDKVDFYSWPEPSDPLWNQWFSEPCILLNLAGENIAAGRWTKKRKQQLTDSRILTTAWLVKAIQMAGNKPRVLVQASASGYYGDRKGEELTEESARGEGFLSSLVLAWENAALKAETYGVRVCLMRTGVVLAKEGGAFPKLALPVRFFAGAWPGNGKQWVSWIHIQDVLRAGMFLAESSDMSGPINLTAPEAVRMKDFVKSIGKVFKRPVMVGIPALLLKLALGSMVRETLLYDQKILPDRLTQKGFKFNYPDIMAALKSLS
jgi:uncharacterized protein (TIGR01777 family)